MLNEKFKQYFLEKEIDLQNIESQISKFKKGIIPSKLIKPAIIGEGVYAPSENRNNYYINLYLENLEYRKIVKFVPASGAASRMFKDIFACVDELKQNQNNQAAIICKFPKVSEVINNLENFAFYNDLIFSLSKRKLCLNDLISSKDYLSIFNTLLDINGLNYSSLPKALLHFHKYENEVRLAIDEHLVEGAFYAQNFNKDVDIHFTISPEHEVWFNENLKNKISIFEQRFGVNYNISYSFQHPSTDTIAVDLENNVFFDENNKIVFRPAGHGALIKNLNEIDADLIFIKNIDNITTDSKRESTYKYKKIIAGILLDKETTIHGNLELLAQENCSDEDVAQIAEYIEKELHESLILNFNNFTQKDKIDYLTTVLNRPIRVCGMVKNEGEPGGGPFYVLDKHGKSSLQIVEKSQIDVKDENQNEILKKSTHFNPVDIVASVVDFKGHKFNLLDFTDEDTYLISEKSKDGKTLKALELPGLWNGAMANWITFFVEVPLETFSPVKEINDLLRPEHKN